MELQPTTCPKCGASVIAVLNASDAAKILIDAEPTLEGSLQINSCCDEHPLVVRSVPELAGRVPLFTEHACSIAGMES